MKRNLALCCAATLFLASGQSVAQSSDLPVIDAGDATPILCLDSTLKEQPLNYVDWGVLKRAMARKFGFAGTIHGDGTGPGTITFSGKQPGQSVRYVAWPDHGGIVLVTMRIRVPGRNADLRGTEMCGDTFLIVNQR